MSRTGRTRGGAAAGRLLGLLTVLLGLLTMHGLASDHHAAAVPAGHAAAPAVVSVQAAEHVGGSQDAAEDRRHEHVVATAPAVAVQHGTGTARAGEAGRACDEDCSDGLAVLCVAVAAALAATVARGRVLLASAGPRPRVRAPTACLRVLPAPDPVAELCVSRT
jgi:hypothetical protein